MFGRKKDKSKEPPRKDAPEPSRDKVQGPVSTGGWEESKVRPAWKPFPGPKFAGEPIRVAVTRQAYADVVAHAKENLTVEVCGVLIGQTCEDEEGLWVSVEHIIRGTSAKQGGAHVTFTQETWNQIHQEKEREYEKKQIVGWYHSHPGFGVEFSDMDRFIQSNFFPGDEQVALVTDPVGGEDALMVNHAGGVKHLSRFWVEGRERKARLPAGENAGGAHDPGGPVGEGGGTKHSAGWSRGTDLRSVEERLSQVLQTVDDLRTAQYRIMLTVGLLAGIGIALWIGFQISEQLRPPKPPEHVSWVPLPVVGSDGKWQLMGAVEMVRWEVSPQLQQAFLAQVIKDLEKQGLTLVPTSQPAPATQPAK